MVELYAPINPETFTMQIHFTATDANLAYCRMTHENTLSELHMLFKSVTKPTDIDQIVFHVDVIAAHGDAAPPAVFTVTLRVDPASITMHSLAKDGTLTYGVLYFKLINLFETYYSKNHNNRKFNSHHTLSKYLGDAPCPVVRRISM